MHRASYVISCRTLLQTRRGLSSGHSVVAAVEASHQRIGRLLAGLPILLLTVLAYEKAARSYAMMILGSAATEQLFMQQLEGVVELELETRNLSTTGELRGLLTPVSEEPRTPGPIKHRAFTLLEPANVSERTRTRHAAMAQEQLPPVATTRHVSMMRPIRLSALIRNQPPETRFYCRKSRSQTEFFSEKPTDWGS